MTDLLPLIPGGTTIASIVIGCLFVSVAGWVGYLFVKYFPE